MTKSPPSCRVVSAARRTNSFVRSSGSDWQLRTIFQGRAAWSGYHFRSSPPAANARHVLHFAWRSPNVRSEPSHSNVWAIPTFRYSPPCASATQSSLFVASSPWRSSFTCLIFQIGGVEELLLRPLDLLTRPHDLDELLAALRWADHDPADQPVVLEEKLAVELLFEAERADRLEPRLDVRRDAHHRQRRPEHRRRIGGNVEEVFVRSRHVAGRDLAVRLRVVPCAHLIVALDHQVVEDGDVSGGVRVRRRRAQLGVGDDPTFQLDLFAHRLRVVVETDAIGQQVELDLVPVHRFRQIAAIAATELLDLIRGDELDALRLAELPAELAALFIQDVAKKPRPAHDPRHLRLLAKAHALGQLVPDEAAAHDEHPLARVGFLDDRVGVVERLKAQTRRHVGRARPWRRFRSAAGRDEDGVVLELLSAIGKDDLVAEVDLGGPGLEMDLDVVLGVVLDRAHEDFFAPHLAPEIARQRDAVVERVPLRGDHHDRRIWMGLAQVLPAGRAGAAYAEADDLLRPLDI